MKGVLISNFNLMNLNGLMRVNFMPDSLEIRETPFGHVEPILLGVKDSLGPEDLDFAVVWTQPQAVIDGYRALCLYEEVSVIRLDEEVKRYASYVRNLLKKVRFVFVPTWTRPTERIFGMLEMKPSLGSAYALMRMNMILSESLQDEPRIILFDAQQWMMQQKEPFDYKAWYMAKIPFTPGVFIAASHDFIAALKTLHGRSKKMIVLDLDNTLWGGLVGEDEWKNLKIGGHDPLGEAYVDFQLALQLLTRRGIMLGIVSKNEESVALEAIRKHPEMRLKLEDFSGWVINWSNKAKNLEDLAKKLNVGLDSIIYIDDEQHERSAIREACPGVEVPEWPEDPLLYKKALLNLNSLNAVTLTAEDAKRTAMYVSERNRKEMKTSDWSLEDWLRSLDIRITSEALNSANLQRAAQLLNKTNQMNLSTRRLTETELKDWANHPDRRVLTFRVEDKFGDAGLVGLLSMERENAKCRIVDFVLSCRVIGRRTEETMLHAASRLAEAWRSEETIARFIATAKNQPCLEFWKTTGFIHNVKEGTFSRKNGTPYPLPKTVKWIEA